jgi:hypothetical protein
MVPNVTGVRAEFVQATGYEVAGSEETAVVIRGFHVLVPGSFVWIESNEKPPRERTVNECWLHRNLSDSPETIKPPSGGLSDDVSDWIPGAFSELSLLSSNVASPTVKC